MTNNIFKNFQCVPCDESCQNLHSLAEHLLENHFCFDCLSDFSSEKLYTLHCLFKHGGSKPACSEEVVSQLTVFLPNFLHSSLSATVNCQQLLSNRENLHKFLSRLWPKFIESSLARSGQLVWHKNTNQLYLDSNNVGESFPSTALPVYSVSPVKFPLNGNLHTTNATAAIDVLASTSSKPNSPDNSDDNFVEEVEEQRMMHEFRESQQTFVDSRESSTNPSATFGPVGYGMTKPRHSANHVSFARRRKYKSRDNAAIRRESSSTSVEDVVKRVKVEFEEPEIFDESSLPSSPGPTSSSQQLQAVGLVGVLPNNGSGRCNVCDAVVPMGSRYNHSAKHLPQTLGILWLYRCLLCEQYDTVIKGDFFRHMMKRDQVHGKTSVDQLIKGYDYLEAESIEEKVRMSKSICFRAE